MFILHYSSLFSCPQKQTAKKAMSHPPPKTLCSICPWPHQSLPLHYYIRTQIFPSISCPLCLSSYLFRLVVRNYIWTAKGWLCCKSITSLISQPHSWQSWGLGKSDYREHVWTEHRVMSYFNLFITRFLYYHLQFSSLFSGHSHSRYLSSGVHTTVSFLSVTILVVHKMQMLKITRWTDL